MGGSCPRGTEGPSLVRTIDAGEGGVASPPPFPAPPILEDRSLKIVPPYHTPQPCHQPKETSGLRSKQWDGVCFLGGGAAQSNEQTFVWSLGWKIPTWLRGT